MIRRHPVSLPLVLTAAFVSACGGGGSPSGPDTTPTPEPGYAVTGSVFYDENANGVLDAAEAVRLPSVTVSIGGRTAASGSSGRFTVSGVPAGVQSASARADSLPAHFAAGPAVSVSVPQAAGEIAVPATLTIGSNKPNVYLAFGDSITTGYGSSDENGYLSWLAADLQAYWGRASLIRDGVPGSRSSFGESRIGTSLAHYRPAHVLILYGTNDWLEAECRQVQGCFTLDALRSIVLQARERDTMPVLATIPPSNPAYPDRSPPERLTWISQMNELIRTMARQERVPLAEVHGAFLRESSLSALFADWVHPNDQGYRLIARAFFQAITQPLAGTSAASEAAPLLLTLPGAHAP